MRHIIGVEKREDPSPTSRAAELSFEGNLNPLPAPFAVTMTDAQTLDGKPCVRFMSDEHPAKNTSAASATEELRSKILEHLDQLRLRVVRPCEQVEDLAKAIKRNAQVVRDEVKRLEKEGLVAPHREGGRRRGVKITEAGVRWLQGPLVSAAA